MDYDEGRFETAEPKGNRGGLPTAEAMPTWVRSVRRHTDPRAYRSLRHLAIELPSLDGQDGLVTDSAEQAAATSPDPDSAELTVAYADVDGEAAVRANRRWWDAEADGYQDEHGEFLGGGADGRRGADFVWCPEGLREHDAHLLGDPAALRGRTVLEVGCGAAQCGAWLAARGARAVAVDVSSGQLRHARRVRAAAADILAAHGGSLLLVQADALRLPLPDASVDEACSAFGAVPFVTDSAALMREVARVLRPGGRWVFSVTHPMRWCFRDDPGPAGIVVERSYFDRSPYTELDARGVPQYVEQHRTLSDRVHEILAAGLTLVDVLEPEWPDGHEREWGQWSPLRGRLFPGTSIYCTSKPRSDTS